MVFRLYWRMSAPTLIVCEPFTLTRLVNNCSDCEGSVLAPLNPSVVNAVLLAKVRFGSCRYCELAAKYDGKPTELGSTPAAGDGCASAMRVKFNRRSSTLVGLMVNTLSRLTPMLLRVSSDPVEMLWKKSFLPWM